MEIADALARRPADRAVLVASYVMRALAADAQGLIAEHFGCLVALGSLVKPLGACAVFKADFVVAASVRCAPAPPYSLGRVGRQRIRRRVMRVGRATEDDRLVG